MRRTVSMIVLLILVSCGHLLAQANSGRWPKVHYDALVSEKDIAVAYSGPTGMVIKYNCHGLSSGACRFFWMRAYAMLVRRDQDKLSVEKRLVAAECYAAQNVYPREVAAAVEFFKYKDSKNRADRIEECAKRISLGEDRQTMPVWWKQEPSSK